MPPVNHDLSRQNIFLFSTFLLLSLSLRLFLLNWYNAPYTDGVFLLTLFEKYNLNNNYPPLYSALLYLVNYFWHDPILSGRLISALSGVGIIAGLFYCGRRFFSPIIGLVAALLYGTAPEVWRWDLRVMTDSLFALLFCGALYFLFCQLKGVGRRNWLWFNLLAVLSALTRYQGLAFMPITLGWLFFILKRRAAASWGNVLAALVAWLSLPAWMLYRGFSQVQQYQESLSADIWLSLGKFTITAELYIYAILYSFGYLASVWLGWGIYLCWKKQKMPKVFLLSSGYLFFIFWLAQSVFMRSFQTRYFLPFWPLAVLFTALGLADFTARRGRLGQIMLGVILLSNLFWSGMVLYWQRDSFGSLKRSAEFVAQNLPDNLIYTCEGYKFTYLAGRFKKGEPFQNMYRILPLKQGTPPSGAFVYINSLYTPDFTALYMEQRENIVYQDVEKVMPILPDVAERLYVNTPQWLSVRLAPQKVYSAILRVP